MLQRSSHVFWPKDNTDGRGPVGDQSVIALSQGHSSYITRTVIEGMAEQSLRTLGLAYR